MEIITTGQVVEGLQIIKMLVVMEVLVEAEAEESDQVVLQRLEQVGEVQEMLVMMVFPVLLEMGEMLVLTQEVEAVVLMEVLE
jgi:hypothetical protein